MEQIHFATFYFDFLGFCDIEKNKHKRFTSFKDCQINPMYARSHLVDPSTLKLLQLTGCELLGQILIDGDPFLPYQSSKLIPECGK